MRLPLLFAAVSLFVAGPLLAQEPPPVELTLSARAIETPVLKYRLFPAEAERKTGNAVPILLRLPWEQTLYMNQVFPTLGEWAARPIGDPEWERFPGVLKSRFYDEMKRAAYRRDAEWEYPIGEEPAHFILLPDVQGLRGFLGRALPAKVRYHLTRGELDEARETILVGLANATHTAQTPFFVNQSVASATQRIMLDRTAELIAQPHSPNLYWALATLPDSLLELKRAADMEASMFAMTLPAAGELDRPRDAAEWNKMLDQLLEVLEFIELPATKDRPALISLARQESAELLGLPAEEVAAMGDGEVTVRWLVRLRQLRDQQIAATLHLPPSEAWPRLEALERLIEADATKTAYAGRHMQPAVMFISTWTVQRKIAALRIIEAVRHHLATGDGAFPGNLGDIRGLSIPRDPLTDQPFEWKVEGGVATLKAPPLPFVPAKIGTAHQVHYRLSIR